MNKCNGMGVKATDCLKYSLLILGAKLFKVFVRLKLPNNLFSQLALYVHFTILQHCVMKNLHSLECIVQTMLCEDVIVGDKNCGVLPT